MLVLDKERCDGAFILCLYHVIIRQGENEEDGDDDDKKNDEEEKEEVFSFLDDMKRRK